MTLGIALGGGGAKGFAHIGALKVLARRGVEFDYVAGTSMGSLVGAAYAAGRLAEFEQEVTGVRLTELPGILSPSWSFQGLFSGKNVLERLSDVIQTTEFKDLKKSFAAISTDLEKAEIVIHDSGDLHRGLRASFSIPGIFTPVVLGNCLLVDGGVMEPVPVDAVRRLGAKRVIAIDLFSNRERIDDKRSRLPIWPRGISTAMNHLRSITPRKKSKKNEVEETSSSRAPHLIELLERSFAVSQIHITRMRLSENPPDFLLTPPATEVGFLDFHRAEAIIARGEEYTESVVDKLLAKIEEWKTLPS